MGTKTWQNGGVNNNWSTAGNWVEGSKPTADDDVVMSGSYNCVINENTATIKSLDQTGYTGIMSGNKQIYIAGAAGVTKVCKFQNGVNHTWSGFLELAPISNAANTKLNVTFNGLNCQTGIHVFGSDNTPVITFLDACTIPSTMSLTLDGGTLKLDGAAGLTHSVGRFNASTATFARTLTLGDATLNITGTAGFTVTNATNFTMTAGSTGAINLTGAGAAFSVAGSGGTSKTFTTVNFTGGGAVTAIGTWSIGTLTVTGTAVKTDSFSLSDAGTKVVTTALTFTGNSAINRLLVKSSTFGTARAITVTGATVTANGADLQDINFVSTGDVDLRGSARYAGNCGNNSLTGGGTNLYFEDALTVTYDQGTGNWSDAANWDNTGTDRVPLPQDTVVITGTGTFTVTVDMLRLGASLSFGASATPTINFTTACTIYGSVDMTNCSAISGTSILTIEISSGTANLTSAGKTFTNGITCNANSGTLHLEDALISQGTLLQSTGTIDASTHDVNVTLASFSQTAGTLNMGDGNWTLTSTGTIWSVNSGTVNCNSSSIYITNTSSTQKTFTGGNKTYNNLYFYGGAGVIRIAGSNTFTNLQMDASNRAATWLNLPAFATTTITTQTGGFNNGDSRLTISTAFGFYGPTGTLVKSGGGTVLCNNIEVYDIVASPSNNSSTPTWYAGGSSIVHGNAGAILAGGMGWVESWNAMMFGD